MINLLWIERFEFDLERIDRQGSLAKRRLWFASIVFITCCD